METKDVSPLTYISDTHMEMKINTCSEQNSAKFPLVGESRMRSDHLLKYYFVKDVEIDFVYLRTESSNTSN